MKEQILDEELAKRFLLGQLSPEEQERIEELAFTDPQSFAFLESAEDDLIDEFVYDDLSSEERDRFQKHFLAQPGRREHLRVARALRHNLEQDEPEPHRSFWDRLRQWFHFNAGSLIPATVGTALVVVAGIGILSLVIRDTSNPPSQLAGQQPSPVPTPTSTVSETPAPGPSPSPSHKGNDNKAPQPVHRPAPSLYAMLAPGGSVRSGGGDTEVSLSSSTAGFELPLVSDKPYRDYVATLNAGSTVINTWSNLKPARSKSIKVIRVNFQLNQLEVSQRYHFVLNGVADNGDVIHVTDYYFRVTN
jgi:hypothetical protein